jgi:hypothetical protein
VDTLVQCGKVAGVFRGAADLRTQSLEQITVGDDTLELPAIIDHEKMMKLESIEDFLDDIEPIIHLNRDNAPRHNAADIHRVRLYAYAMRS